MEKIEGVNLEELVEESSADLVEEKKKSVAGLIKQQLQRMERLATEIKNLEKEINGKRDKLKKIQEKIEKIKNGDWSVLTEKKEQKEQKNE